MRDSSYPFRLVNELSLESCLGNRHTPLKLPLIELKAPVPYLRQYDHLMPSHMERNMLGQITRLGPR